jgi:serine/threonine protein phosphatase PrpC
MKTHIGLIRQVNEDSAEVIYRKDHDHVLLAVVADGMGGHQAGDVASQMTLQKLKEFFEVVDLNKDITEWEGWLLASVQETNQYIYQYALEKESLQGMGTTIVAILLLENEYIIAHVGDSRIYRYLDGQLDAVTSDHSLVNELVKSGEITKEEAEQHPQRNVITRALGTEPQVEVDLRTLSYLGNEQFLLCSDGLSNMLKEEQIKETLAKSMEVQDKAEQLLQLALEAGGEDNISLIVVQTEADELEGK